MVSPEVILRYWLDEVGPEGWYAGGETLDRQIRDRFRMIWDEAMAGAYGLWLTYPGGTLAYIILTDQFPRNIFRDGPRAFESDRSARAAAKIAMSRDWDLKIDAPARQFFYLPLMHSENLIDQERAVRLFASRMPDSQDSLLHARAHRDVIRRFGRFPFRNAALGRTTSPAEAEWLAQGGYGATVREIGARQTAA